MNIHFYRPRRHLSYRNFKCLIRFQFNYWKEMTRGHRSSTHEFERRMQNNFGRSFDGARAPFFPARRAPTRSVDPGAHEFLLKAAISLSPDKSWWVIRRHQSRCQRRLRRGPHRLPIHIRTCTRIYTHDTHYTLWGTRERERARWTNFFGLFQTAARCYVKLGEKAMGRRRAVAPSPSLLTLEFLMRPFSGHCPRKSRTAARTTPRGAPKCSGLFPLPLAVSSSSSCLLSSLYFYLFFFSFVISVEPWIPFPRLPLALKKYRLTWDRALCDYAVIYRCFRARRCLIARAEAESFYFTV